MKLYVESIRSLPGRPTPRFEIKSYNASTGIGIVVGSLGLPFEHQLDKEFLQRAGYRIVKVEDKAAQPIKTPEPETAPSTLTSTPWPFAEDEE